MSEKIHMISVFTSYIIKYEANINCFYPKATPLVSCLQIHNTDTTFKVMFNLHLIYRIINNSIDITQ